MSVFERGVPAATMTYTFDQMMKGEGLPENNQRYTINGRAPMPPIREDERSRAEQIVRTNFLSKHGEEPASFLAAEQDGIFICMAW